MARTRRRNTLHTRVIEVLLVVAVLPVAARAGEERLALRLASGTQVQVRLVRASDDPARLPAIVVLGGLERGAGAIDLIPRTREAVLVGLDYPFAMPAHVQWAEALPLARRLERGIHETIEALQRLHALLSNRADIDSARLIIVGVSFGAPFAVIAAAERDYRGVALIDGFGDLPYVLRYQFARRWRPHYGLLGEALAWLTQQAVVRLVDLPDLERSARRLRADQRVCLIDSEDDEFVPPRSRQALQQALRESPARLSVHMLPGRHVRAHDEQAIARLYALARDWMRTQGLVD